MSSQPNTNGMAAAAQIINIENLINSYNSKLDGIQKESKQLKEMLQSVLDNNEEYQKMAKEADKLAKLKTLEKQKVLKTSEASTLVDKIKEKSSELREIKVALSDYLTQYFSLSGNRQIEMPDGVLMEIIYSAKLVKKKN